jgi:hypothetical protein
VKLKKSMTKESVDVLLTSRSSKGLETKEEQKSKLSTIANPEPSEP